jgi:hypothetical protein
VSAQGERAVVGVLATPGLPRELAEDLDEELADDLRDQVPGPSWRVVVSDAPLDRAFTAREIVDEADERRRSMHWQLAICLTDLPLRISHRPVIAHGSAEHQVGLVSVPALGAFGLRRRVRHAALRVLQGLTGNGGGLGHDLDDLSASQGRERERGEGSVRFTANAVRGNLRLLAGMVRANNPSLVIIRMSRALAAALGTAAFSLASANAWLMADGSGWPRLLVISAGAVLATCVVVVVAHRLWQRPARSESQREQIVLFNFATVLTVLLGGLTLYLALFVVCVLCGAALIPSGVLGSQLGHGVSPGDYLKLAWFASSFAMIGGALGSVVESDLSVREAMYGADDDD